MRKHIALVGLIILFSCVGLSGCNEQHNVDEKSKFFGTWKNVYELEGTITENIWVIYENDTINGSTIKNGNGYNNYTQTNWFYYKVENGQICTSETLGQYKSSQCIYYELSNNDTTLTLLNYYQGAEQAVFNKI